MGENGQQVNTEGWKEWTGTEDSVRVLGIGQGREEDQSHPARRGGCQLEDTSWAQSPGQLQSLRAAAYRVWPEQCPQSEPEARR